MSSFLCCAAVVRGGCLRIVLAVIQDHLEHPVGALRQVVASLARCAVPVEDALQVAVGREARLGAVALVQLRHVDAGGVLGL